MNLSQEATLFNNITAHNNISNSNISHHFGHNLSEQFVTPIAVYFIVLAVGGIVFNFILIYTIATNRSLYSVSNVLIVNLALCDLITAVTGDYLV